MSGRIYAERKSEIEDFYFWSGSLVYAASDKVDLVKVSELRARNTRVQSRVTCAIFSKSSVMGSHIENAGAMMLVVYTSNQIDIVR